MGLITKQAYMTSSASSLVYNVGPTSQNEITGTLPVTLHISHAIVIWQQQTLTSAELFQRTS